MVVIASLNRREAPIDVHCGQAKATELSKLKKRQSKMLWAVLAINMMMFAIEFLAGIRADSLSLTVDSLDNIAVTIC